MDDKASGTISPARRHLVLSDHGTVWTRTTINSTGDSDLLCVLKSSEDVWKIEPIRLKKKKKNIHA